MHDSTAIHNLQFALARALTDTDAGERAKLLSMITFWVMDQATLTGTDDIERIGLNHVMAAVSEHLNEHHRLAFGENDAPDMYANRR